MFSRHVFRTSSRHVFKTSSRHVFKTCSRRLQRNNFSSSKTSSRCLYKASWRRLGRRKNVMLKAYWRRLQDKTYLEDVFNSSCRPTNVWWEAFRPASLLKRDSITDVFLWNFANFKNIFFYRTRPVADSGSVKILQSCHFNIFGINDRCFRNVPNKKDNE